MKQMTIPTSLQLKLIEKDKNKHLKKLDEILTQDRKTKVISKDISNSLKLSQVRQNNIKATQKGKEVQLEQENELLLGKLVEISRKKSPSFPVRSESANGKSLNAPYKKREMMRISSENEAFAKRLISQQSTFNRKKLDTDFRKHKEMVGNLKRINSSPLKNLGRKILPPIKSELTSPKTVSLKQNELKSSNVKENVTTQKEQPEQQSPVAPAIVANDSKIVIAPVVVDKKEEASPKEKEAAPIDTVKQNKEASVVEATDLQKPQEAQDQAVQGNQSQRAEKVEAKQDGNNDSVQNETK